MRVGKQSNRGGDRIGSGRKVELQSQRERARIDALSTLFGTRPAEIARRLALAAVNAEPDLRDLGLADLERRLARLGTAKERRPLASVLATAARLKKAVHAARARLPIPTSIAARIPARASLQVDALAAILDARPRPGPACRAPSLSCRVCARVLHEATTPKPGTCLLARDCTYEPPLAATPHRHCDRCGDAVRVTSDDVRRTSGPGLLICFETQIVEAPEGLAMAPVGWFCARCLGGRR